MSDKELTVDYSSAGNLVSLTIDKYYNIVSLNIDESILTKDQKPLLEEMIVSSINEAIDKMMDLNAKEEKEKEKDSRVKPPLNFNKSDIAKMAGDLSKFTSVKYENGKPVLTVSLDSINPEIMLKMGDLMNGKKDDKED